MSLSHPGSNGGSVCTQFQVFSLCQSLPEYSPNPSFPWHFGRLLVWCFVKCLFGFLWCFCKIVLRLWIYRKSAPEVMDCSPHVEKRCSVWWYQPQSLSEDVAGGVSPLWSYHVSLFNFGGRYFEVKWKSFFVSICPLIQAFTGESCLQ